ncbi:hypothetical protein GLOIN_2v1869416 [Rhizophagus clarus]|nr:hypothetical protein GLOIN_2v1869416 [Rhizophagus clarus]
MLYIIIEDEIKIKIFKYVEYPLNLLLTFRSWLIIAKDPYAKTEWLLVHYEKTHALYHAVRYHAVRFGHTFIDVPVCQSLITRIQVEIEHNVGQLDANRIRTFQQKIKSIWANDLPMSALAYLLVKSHVNANKELYSKRNYVKLFHFLSAVFHVINHARIQKKNLKYFEDLILKKQFVLFLPSPKVLQMDLKADSYIYRPHISEEYVSKSGCGDDKPNLSKLNSFLGQESFLSFQTTPITVLTLRIRPLRNINRVRRRNQFRRCRRNRRQINNNENEDMLNLIVNLPPQPITSDPFIDQFFNGSAFI